MNKKILTVTNISKSFENINVLNNISLDVNKGEFISIVGSSGCGKTTLLNILSGMDNIFDGLVTKYYDEYDLNRLLWAQRVLPYINKEEGLTTTDKNEIYKSIITENNIDKSYPILPPTIFDGLSSLNVKVNEAVPSAEIFCSDGETVSTSSWLPTTTSGVQPANRAAMARIGISFFITIWFLSLFHKLYKDN